MELKFDERGLIPAIVQDHYTKEVLTLAYMNKESLAITPCVPTASGPGRASQPLAISCSLTIPFKRSTEEAGS